MRRVIVALLVLGAIVACSHDTPVVPATLRGDPRTFTIQPNIGFDVTFTSSAGDLSGFTCRLEPVTLGAVTVTSTGCHVAIGNVAAPGRLIGQRGAVADTVALIVQAQWGVEPGCVLTTNWSRRGARRHQYVARAVISHEHQVERPLGRAAQFWSVRQIPNSLIMGGKMSHYARLAAIGIRFLAIAALLYWAPTLLMGLSVTRMNGVSEGMPSWALAWTLLYPILAVILFLVARPLGNLVARGLEWQPALQRMSEQWWAALARRIVESLTAERHPLDSAP
jgi:hypothetical protein